MKSNLQLQYMESSNEVDFLIYEVLDPTPILCTLEENRSIKYQNKDEMKSHCERIVTCVNVHNELVKALQDIQDMFIHQEGEVKQNKLKTDIIKYCPNVRDTLNKVRQLMWTLEKRTDAKPIEQ